MDNCKDWRNGRFKAFCCIGAMVAFVGFMLLWSIWHKSTEVYVSRPFMTVDSLYMKVAKDMTVRNGNFSKKNLSDSDKLKYKLDSIDAAFRALDRTILVLEKQTELRQDDIRQETNNIINKFNGNIEWWIFLLGIICGVAPILLTFLNHQKDAEYIELLNDNFEKMAAQMKDKEDALREKEEELDKVKRTLLKADSERQLDWEKKQKELKLVFSFMYISSFTKKAKFQVSAEREIVIERLLKTITDASLEYLDFETSESMKDRDIDMSFWILAALEGMVLLRPFVENMKICRQMDEVLKCLRHLQERFYNGDVIKHNEEDIAKLKKEMLVLKLKKWGEF